VHDNPQAIGEGKFFEIYHTAKILEKASGRLAICLLEKSFRKMLASGLKNTFHLEVKLL
jgi:hypothetical protein